MHRSPAAVEAFQCHTEMRRDTPGRLIRKTYTDLDESGLIRKTHTVPLSDALYTDISRDTPR